MHGSRPEVWSLFAHGSEDRNALSKPVYELNRQCIDLLVKAASAETPELRLARQFQGPFRTITSEGRAKVAQQFYLLVDIRFTDPVWWTSALKHPSGTPVSPLPAFPRASAIQIGRAAIMLLRHATHVFGLEASLLGAHPQVLQILTPLSLSDLDRFLDRFFKEVRPRWEQRPALWQGLIQSASTPDLRMKRDLDLKGLHLLASQILQ